MRESHGALRSLGQIHADLHSFVCPRCSLCSALPRYSASDMVSR